MSAGEEYLQQYGNAIIRSTRGTRLFPSVMAAQGILESGYGRSSLAAEYNNHFGIKADSSWQGPVVWLMTRDIINGQEIWREQPWRVYDSPFESFRDRVKFLQENKRYERAGVFSAPTPRDQADALLAAGYAGDPRYGELIEDLINKYDLAKLDRKKTASSILRMLLIVTVVILVIIGWLMWLHASKSEKNK